MAVGVVFPASWVVCDGQRRADRAQHRGREAEPLDREVREVRHLLERRPELRVRRERGDRSLDDRPAVLQPEQRDVLAQEIERSAVQHPLEVLHRDLEHLLGDCLLDLARPRGDRLLRELPLERILRVQDELNGRVADPLRDQIVDLAHDVHRDDQRRLRLAVLDLRDRLLAGVDLDRLDRLEQLVGVLGDVDLLVAEVELALARRHGVVQRHLRLPRRARERQPDHQRDHDRVHDQQPDEQRRALEDLQVLDEQPAHRVSGRVRAGSARTRFRSRRRAAARHAL